MGEKIRDLGTVVIGNEEFVVELNKGTGTNRKYDIHIQNSKVRLNISEYDFCKIASAIICADKRILHYKEGK